MTLYSNICDGIHNMALIQYVGKHGSPRLENITSCSLVLKEKLALLLLADKNSLEPVHLNESASINHRVQCLSLSRGIQRFPAVTNDIVDSATLSLLHKQNKTKNINKIKYCK